MTAADRPAVLALAVAQTVVWAGLYYSFPAMLPLVVAQTGWTLTEVATIFSLTLLLAAGAAPVAGSLIDRGHGRALLASASALGAIALILIGWAPNYWAFAGLWCVIGLCQGCALYDPAFSVLTRAYGAGARGPITTVTLVAGFAGTLAFPTVHALSALGGWRLAAQGMGALILLITVPLTLFAVRRIGQTTAPTPPEPDAAPILRHPAFWALAGAFFLLMLTVGAVVTHILPLLVDRGVPTTTAVLAAASIGPMQVAGRIALMRLGAVSDERRLALISWTALLLALPALALAGISGVFLVMFVALFGAGYGATSILRPLIVRRVLGATAFGRKAGLVGAAALLGAAGAPAAGATLVSLSGYGAMLIAGFCAASLGLGALGLAFARGAAQD